MTDKRVWFITGAGRGMGVDILAMSGKQGGDPAKLAAALITIDQEQPPLRWVAGADAIVRPSSAGLTCPGRRAGLDR